MEQEVARLITRVGIEGAEETQRQLGRLGDSISDLGKNVIGGALKVGLLGAAAGFGTLATGIVASTKAAMESQQVEAQLDAVLKSTAGVAGVTKKQVLDLADSLSQLTMFDDEAIVSGQNILLTFTKIGKDVFPDATRVMLDMSQALGQDLKSSAIQLGKALQDPVNGVDALRRVGVNFSDEQQKMIKTLVESGKTLDAQKFILKELQTEFGGSAEAAGKTFAGQMKILNTQVQNLLESIGMELLPVFTELVTEVNKGLPAFREWAEKAIPILVTGLRGLVRWIRDNVLPALRQLAQWIGDNVVPALLQLAKWIGDNVVPALRQLAQWIGGNVVPALLQLAQWIGDNVVPALRQLAQWIGDNVVPVLRRLGDLLSGTLLKSLSSAEDGLRQLPNAVQAILRFITPIVDRIANELSVFWREIEPKLRKAWGNISRVINDAMQFIWENVIQPIAQAIKSFLDRHGDDILRIMKGVWNEIAGTIKVVWETIKGIIKVALDILGGDFDEAAKDWKDTQQAVWAAIQQIIRGAWDIIKGIVSIALSELLNFMSARWNDLVNGVRSAWDSATNAVRNAAVLLADAARSAVQGMINAALSLAGGLLDVLTSPFRNAVWTIVNTDWWGVARNVVQGLINGVLSIASGIYDNLIAPFINAVSTIIRTDWWGVARMIAQALANGIASVADAIYHALFDPFSNAIQMIKRLLGIASPSKLMQQIGEQMAAGLERGFQPLLTLPTMAGMVATRAASPGSSVAYHNYYNLTIHSRAQTEQVVADFAVLRALSSTR